MTPPVFETDPQANTFAFAKQDRFLIELVNCPVNCQPATQSSDAQDGQAVAGRQQLVSFDQRSQ